MKLARTSWLAGSALLIGAVLPGTASAQSTWNLISGGGCTQNAASSGNFGNSWACTGSGNGGTSATAYAYSTQYGVGTGAAQSINTATQYANAYMSSQGTSGFGAANRTEGLGAGSPDHAVDNNPTASYDMIVLNFGASVVLNQIGIGWSSNASGADISVLRWTGGGAPTSTAAVSTGGNSALLRTGWTLVSSLADVLGDNSAPYGTNARNTYGTEGSSWWMISAFNTTLNTGNFCYTNNSNGKVTESAAANTSAKCDDGDDAFKLNWLKTSAYTAPTEHGSVPEPGSLALVALCLLGATAARKRAMNRT